MRTFLLMILMTAATPALACNADFIRASGLKIEQVKIGESVRVNVAFNYTITGSRAVRMIDATATIADALGWEMERIAIPRTTPIRPGDIVAYSDNHVSGPLIVAAKANPDDISITTCVRAVIYDDGTKERFE